MCPLILGIAGPAAAHAETIYDQPYLGDHAVAPPARELAGLCGRAELVFVGTTRTLAATAGDGRYAASVAIDRVLKGGPGEERLDLSWSPSATGIDAGSQHLFFVAGPAESPVVLKEMYIQPGESGFIRAYGYLDGDTESTLAVVEALLHPDRPRGAAAELLLADAEGTDFQRRQTAARLALELGTAEVVPALAALVRTENDVFEALAAELLRLAGVDRLDDVLAAVLTAPFASRWTESRAFAAIASTGGSDFVEPLAAFGDAHAELRVSCAFALAGIGDASSSAALGRWIADAEADGSTEHVDRLDGGQRPRSDLLREALADL